MSLCCAMGWRTGGVPAGRLIASSSITVQQAPTGVCFQVPERELERILSLPGMAPCWNCQDLPKLIDRRRRGAAQYGRN